jgi:arabinofuranosyltransferase
LSADTVVKLVRRFGAAGVMVASVLALAAGELNYAHATYDDAFIFFRYAANLADGHGLVFNPGERVEGYTSFLWTILLAPAAWFGASNSRLGFVVFAKIAGSLMSFATVGLIVKTGHLMSSSRRGSRSFGWVAPAFLAFEAPFVLWSVGALETPLVTLLLLIAVSFHLRDRLAEERASNSPRSAVTFALAALARPEVVALFAATAIFDFGRRLATRSFRANLKTDLLWVAGFVVPYGAFLLWRFSYYGQWLPNTYYAKVYGDPLVWIRGQTYVMSALTDLGLGIIFAASLLTFLFTRRITTKAAYIGILIVTHLIATATEGGDWMPGFRFIVPILPLVGLLLQAAAVEAENCWPLARMKVALAMSVAALLGCSTWMGLSAIPSSVRDVTLVPAEHEEVATWLNNHVAKGSLLALGEAGVVPYYTHLAALDFFGIVDTHIAHLRGIRHHKFDVDYVLHRKPDYVLMLALPHGKDGKPESPFTYAQQLWQDPRFGEQYRILQEFRSFILYERFKDPT